MSVDFILRLLEAGWLGLLDYLSAHVLFCLVPAFFLAGAFNALIPQETILKMLGRKARAYVSYTIAAVSGFFIEVCSCTILPLFAGIWKKGAGLGPAIAFLYAGPAINVMAVSLTAKVIGWDIAIARLILSITFSLLIGALMAIIFREDQNPAGTMAEQLVFKAKVKRPGYQLAIFLIILVSILVLGTAPLSIIFGGKAIEVMGSEILLSNFIKYLGTLLLTIALGGVALIWYSKAEIKTWLLETFKFIRMIFPLLLVGVFFASMISILMPRELFMRYVGKNTLEANLIGVLSGVFAYFPALVEVPIAEQFLKLGMNKGPLLSYLLADPVLSLQSILIVNKILRPKRTIVYVTLITVLTTTAGLIFGALTT